MRRIINLSSRRAAMIELSLIGLVACAVLIALPAIDSYASRHVTTFLTNLNPV